MTPSDLIRLARDAAKAIFGADEPNLLKPTPGISHEDCGKPVHWFDANRNGFQDEGSR